MKYGKNIIVWYTFDALLLRIRLIIIASPTETTIPSTINTRLYKIVFRRITNKSFDLPELSKAETARNFINILENKSEVVDLLDNEISKDINVYFGDELDDENLKDFSIVTLRSDEKDLGTIGIIGPKRMNYSKIISVMRYIQRLIDEGGK